MAAQFSLSVRTGKGSLTHNNREFIAENVDKNRVDLDVCLERKPLDQVYDEIFGQALKEYNAKQKRNDRKITNYMEHIKRSQNKEKLFHEVIIEFGNKDHHPDHDMAERLLCKAHETFKKSNPNCVVFNSVIHFDEATPHLHIDFVMIKRNVKKGLSVQNSKRGALVEMGYGTGKEEFKHWISDTRNILTKLACENGIDIADAGAVGEKNINIHEFRKVMRSYDQELSHIPDIDFKEKTNILGNPTGEIIIKKEALVAINKKAKLSATMAKNIEQRENKFMDDIKGLLEQNHDLFKQNQKLSEENRTLSGKLQTMHDSINNLVNVAKTNLMELGPAFVKAINMFDKSVGKEYEAKQKELHKPKALNLKISRPGKSTVATKNRIRSILKTGQEAQRFASSCSGLMMVPVKDKNSIKLAVGIVKLAQSVGADIPNCGGGTNGPDLNSMNEIEKEEIIEALEKAGRLDEAMAMENEHGRFR